MLDTILANFGRRQERVLGGWLLTLVITCLAVCTITLASSGSPLLKLEANFLACSTLICGGNGDTLGPVLNSSSTGKLRTDSFRQTMPLHPKEDSSGGAR
jgi:hypothetical protein